MRNIITTILVLISIDLYSQDFNGYYKSDRSSYVRIYNDSLIYFNVYYGACLLDLHRGCGKIRIFNDSIVVKTEDTNDSLKPTIKIISDIGDKSIIKLKVNGEDNNPLVGCNVVAVDQEGNFVKGNITDKNGLSTINTENKSEKVEVSNIGYDRYVFNINDYKGKFLILNLRTGHMIKGDSLYFRIISKDPLTLEGLYYLSEVQKHEKKVSIKIRYKLRIIFTRWPWRWHLFKEPKDIHKLIRETLIKK